MLRARMGGKPSAAARSTHERSDEDPAIGGKPQPPSKAARKPAAFRL